MEHLHTVVCDPVTDETDVMTPAQQEADSSGKVQYIVWVGVDTLGYCTEAFFEEHGFEYGLSFITFVIPGGG